MAKKRVNRVSLALSEELGLLLSPFTLTLKHVVKLHSKVGGFVFVFPTTLGQYQYHSVRVASESGGLPVKPLFFPIPQACVEGLLGNRYCHWFYFDEQYLYPVQRTKPSTLLETFLFKPNGEVPHVDVLLDTPEPEMWLRKKPLLALRPELPSWDDYLNTPESALLNDA